MQLDLFKDAYPRTHRADTGIELKAAGQKRAAENAGSEWVNTAIARLRSWLFFAPREFRFEQFRAYAEATGMPSPPSPNAWGALPAIAARRGLIRFSGRYEPAQSPRTHGHPVKVWEVV